MSVCNTGKAWLQSPARNLIENTTSQARIQGIQRLHSVRPLVSQEDVLRFLFAWEMGREYGGRTFGHPDEESTECDLSLEYLNEVDGNLMTARDYSS
jgi:hypothetical protein